MGRLMPGQGIPRTKAAPPHSQGLRPRACAIRAVQKATNGTRKTRRISVVSNPKMRPSLRDPGMNLAADSGTGLTAVWCGLALSRQEGDIPFEYTRIYPSRQISKGNLPGLSIVAVVRPCPFAADPALSRQTLPLPGRPCPFAADPAPSRQTLPFHGELVEPWTDGPSHRSHTRKTPINKIPSSDDTSPLPISKATTYHYYEYVFYTLR